MTASFFNMNLIHLLGITTAASTIRWTWTLQPSRKKRTIRSRSQNSTDHYSRRSTNWVSRSQIRCIV